MIKSSDEKPLIEEKRYKNKNNYLGSYQRQNGTFISVWKNGQFNLCLKMDNVHVGFPKVKSFNKWLHYLGYKTIEIV